MLGSAIPMQFNIINIASIVTRGFNALHSGITLRLVVLVQSRVYSFIHQATVAVNLEWI